MDINSGLIINYNIIECRKLKLLLTNVLQCSSKFCGICLGIGKEYVGLNDYVGICYFNEESRNIEMCTILESLFDEKSLQWLASADICQDCKKQAIDAFVFVTKTKKSAEILAEYLHQMNERIDESQIVIDSNGCKDYDNMLLVLNDPKELKSEIKEELDVTMPTDLEIPSVIASNKDLVYLKYMNINMSNSNNMRHKFICDYCQKEFLSRENITEHLKNVHFLPVSDQTLKAKNRLVDRCQDCEHQPCPHEKYWKVVRQVKKKGQMLYRCPDCEYVVKSKVSLFIAHAAKAHIRIPNYICEFCAMPLYSDWAHRRHKMSCGIKTNFCTYCEGKFQTKECLEVHETECRKQDRSHKCSQCPASFNTMQKLTKHALLNHEQKKYPCNQCKRIFASEYAVMAHQEIHIYGKRTYNRKKLQKPCGFCNKLFTNIKLLKEHVKIHNAGEKASCKICNLKFDTQKEFEIHHNTHINNCKRIKQTIYCQFCNFTTKDKQLLDSHINVKHLKVLPFRCEVCDRLFTNDRQLTHHKWTHTGLKPPVDLECDVCGCHLRSKRAMIYHKRRHLGEKPLKCDKCEESFVCESMLESHKWRAHGKKTIKCPLCDMMFYAVRFMRGHFKRSHWKRKGEKFDCRKVEGLKEEYYDYFKDRRYVANVLTLKNKEIRA